MKKILFILFSFVFAAVLLEASLWVICLVSPKANTLLSRSNTSAAVPDQLLDYRPNPAFSGHDSRGFRNKSVPGKVDIVCIGDSQTYGSGIGVAPESAWPQQLAQMNGKTVYNMAFGSYGPAHYLALTGEALAMKPAAIIAGFYEGNDLYDVFNMVYVRNKLGELKTADLATVETLERLEKDSPLLGMIQGGRTAGNGLMENLGRAFTDHSKFFGVLRAMNRLAVNNRLPGTVFYFFQRPFTNNAMAYDDGRFRTVFSVRERLLALDINDARISESLNMSLEAFRRMKGMAAAANVRFYVLFIPTKELVFEELVFRNMKTVPASYRTLMSNEYTIRNAAKRYLSGQNIAFFDALPALKECLNAGVQPYFVTNDGHPNAIGYNAIAKSVNDGLKELKPVSDAKPDQSRK